VGREGGLTGRAATPLPSGEIEGFFSRDDFIRHFRCNEVDVGITAIDHRASEITDAYTQCSDSCARQRLSRIYDVRAVQMTDPFVAYTDTGERQFGNRGDYLLQAELVRPIVPVHLFVDDKARSSSVSDKSVKPARKSDAVAQLALTEIDMADDTKSRAESTSSEPTDLHKQLHGTSAVVRCQWSVSSGLFSLHYFPVAKLVEEEEARRQRQDSTISDITVADQLDAFRSTYRDVPNIFAQPFDVYSCKVLCWEGVLKKRSKLLRQWQGKQCELYPDKLVIGKDVEYRKSVTGSDAFLSEPISPSSPKRNQSFGTDAASYICLKNCSVHQTLIDDKPVIYLGNARMNDDDSAQLPLEPFHVTSDFKRWESRYTKWFSVGTPPAAAATSSRPSDLSKISNHQSFSNKSGIFVQAADSHTHDALVALLEMCILFCRRDMAFAAAAEGNCQRTLEVLCSVSPADACKIVSSPNDPKSGRLLQHEASRTSLELLHTIYQFFEFDQEDVKLFEKPSIVMRPSSIADISSTYSIEPLLSSVRPNSKCSLGLSCLHYAVESSKLDIVEFIVENSFLEMPVNSTTLSGQTPLHFAQTSKIVYYLLENGANPVALDFQGNSPLMLMAERGNFAALTALLRKTTQEDININIQSWKTGSTALMNAINRLSKSATDYSDVLILVELLLHYGADPEVPDIQKNTCLHSVCSIFRAACSDTSKDPARREITQHVIASCQKLMTILVDYGSNKKAINSKGHIPFTIVAQSKNYAVNTATVRSVLETVIYATRTVGADANPSETKEDNDLDAREILNFRTETGASGLHLAVEAINPDILQYLLEKGVDANCKDSRGFTPLDVLKSKQSRAGGGMVERQAADLLKCLTILYDNGAVRRLRADLPVEHDDESIIFSHLQCGRYHVKSATLDAMVKRLCNDQLYCDDDARALVLAYKKVCSHSELLQKLVDEFQAQIEVVQRSKSYDNERDSMDQHGASIIAQPASDDIVDLRSNVGREDFTSGEPCEIETKSREVSTEGDAPRAGYGVSGARSVSEVKDANDLSSLLRNEAVHDDEILRPGGILSTVMMWFNMMEGNFGKHSGRLLYYIMLINEYVISDDAGEDFYTIARHFTNLVLRNCPEELSRESTALLIMGLSKNGLNQVSVDCYHNHCLRSYSLC
jgi:ankyrin repeat protein